jgi:hypothetical protein
MAEELPQRVVTINPDEVPPHLHALIPLAEEWGTWNPHRCDEIIEQKNNEELRSFVSVIESHRSAIDAWLDAVRKDGAQKPKAAEAFLWLIRNWNEAACELYGREHC